MKHIDFEEWLKEWHMREYTGTDDDAPDAYEKWITELPVDDMISFANLAIKENGLRGMNHMRDLIVKTFNQHDN